MEQKILSIRPITDDYIGEVKDVILTDNWVKELDLLTGFKIRVFEIDLSLPEGRKELKSYTFNPEVPPKFGTLLNDVGEFHLFF